VEQALDSAPRVVALYTREGNEAMRLEPGYVYFGTGSDCPYVVDSETGERRRATKKDIEIFARLCDALPNIDFILSMGIASDVPTQSADLHHFQAMAYNTSKPILFTVVESENMPHVVDFASDIAGGATALQQRPFVGLFAMPSPPLRHSKNALRNLMYCARHSIPVVYASGTQLGTSGPMTIAGGTVSSNCDVLSGLVVHQLANPGAPFVYGVCVAPLDMRSTIECYGAPEHFLGDLVNGQVAHSYGLPTFGYAGDTDSKTLDLQAAMEYVGSTLIGLLSHVNLLHDVGYLESGLAASCESIVLADQVIEFARRMLQRVDVSEESLALQMIKRVGPGGTFLQEKHTLDHFRDFWYSPLVDRRRYGQWVDKGRQTMADRLKAQAREILATHQPQSMAESVIRSIDSVIAEQDKKAKSKK
jgi:trimethylamine--corrinoid protein Co-methyltransferase